MGINIMAIDATFWVAVSFVIFLISCTNSNNEEANSANQNIWNLSDGVEFPADRPLSRAEDGVFLNDGTLIVADQRYGLAKIEVDGTVEPFGNLKFSKNSCFVPMK